MRRPHRRAGVVSLLVLALLLALGAVEFVGRGCGAADCVVTVPYQVSNSAELDDADVCAVFTSIGSVRFSYRQLVIGRRYTARVVTPGPVQVSLRRSCGSADSVTGAPLSVSQSWQGSLHALEVTRGNGPDPVTPVVDPRRGDAHATAAAVVLRHDVAIPLRLNGWGTTGLDQRPCAFGDVLVAVSVAQSQSAAQAQSASQSRSAAQSDSVGQSGSAAQPESVGQAKQVLAASMVVAKFSVCPDGTVTSLLDPGATGP